MHTAQGRSCYRAPEAEKGSWRFGRCGSPSRRHLVVVGAQRPPSRGRALDSGDEALSCQGVPLARHPGRRVRRERRILPGKPLASPMSDQAGVSASTGAPSCAPGQTSANLPGALRPLRLGVICNKHLGRTRQSELIKTPARIPTGTSVWPL